MFGKSFNTAFGYSVAVVVALALAAAVGLAGWYVFRLIEGNTAQARLTTFTALCGPKGPWLKYKRDPPAAVYDAIPATAERDKWFADIQDEFNKLDAFLDACQAGQ